MACDAAAVRSSTASSFNKCFFVNSLTLCLVYKTKCSEQSSDTIRGAIQIKLSTCSLRWDPSDVLMVQRPLICQKIKANLIYHIMTPLKIY